MARSLLASMDAVISNTPRGGEVWHFNSYKYYAIQYNRLVERISTLNLQGTDLLNQFNENKIPGVGDTIHIQQHSIFQAVHGELSMLCSWIDIALGGERKSQEVQSLANFIQNSLRPAILRNTPSTELEIQDTIERILIGRELQKGIDYDRETGRVKHSMKEFIPDFIFRGLSTALEVKFVGERSRLSKIVDEINADVIAYQKGYKFLIFVVYDLGYISDVEEFRRDIESERGGVSVIIVKQ